MFNDYDLNFRVIFKRIRQIDAFHEKIVENEISYIDLAALILMLVVANLANTK